MPAHKPSKAFRRQTIAFLEAVKARSLQRHLQHLFFLYTHDLQIGLPVYHKELVDHIDLLMDFLYAVEKEQQRQKKKANAERVAPPEKGRV